MHGQIAIPKIEVDENGLGFNEIDFFQKELQKFNPPIGTGWYAWKLEDEIYYFKWANFMPSTKYLKALQDDGWYLAYPIENSK